MTTATPKLIEEIKKLSLVVKERKTSLNDRDNKVDENRQKGCDELFEELKVLIPDKVKSYAGYGRTEARVFEFKFKDGLKRGNTFVKDLLTRGDVISRLQSFLDTDHSDDQGPSFFVYFTHIGRYQVEHDENKFGVFVNWDKESWAQIKERLANSRARTRSDFSSRGAPRGRGGFRGRGAPRGRLNVNRAESHDALPESHDALPESHDALPESHDALPESHDD